MLPYRRKKQECQNKNAVLNDDPGNKEGIDNWIQLMTISLSQIQTLHVTTVLLALYTIFHQQIPSFSETAVPIPRSRKLRPKITSWFHEIYVLSSRKLMEENRTLHIHCQRGHMSIWPYQVYGKKSQKGMLLL